MSEKKLATNIIEQLAQTEPAGLGFRVTVPAIGYDQTFIKDGPGKLDGVVVRIPLKTTKAEALDLATAHLSKEIDDGALQLSDTWVEDNLEA